MASAGRVVIAGGTGFVGGEVVKTFQRLGYETWVVSRLARVNTAKTPSLLFSKKNEDIKNLTSWDNIQVISHDTWIILASLMIFSLAASLAGLWL